MQKLDIHIKNSAKIIDKLLKYELQLSAYRE